jgi:hypothetical protein
VIHHQGRTLDELHATACSSFALALLGCGLGLGLGLALLGSSLLLLFLAVLAVVLSIAGTTSEWLDGANENTAKRSLAVGARLACHAMPETVISITTATKTSGRGPSCAYRQK